MKPVGRKITVRLRFEGFVNHVPAEIAVLFAHNAIPFKTAVEAIKKDGPGLHGRMILLNIGRALLEKGEFEAFARARGWWPHPHSTPSVQDFLLGMNSQLRDVALIMGGQLTEEMVVLAMQAELLLDGYQTVLQESADWDSIYPTTAYFWPKRKELIAQARRPVPREVLNDRLAKYGLRLRETGGDWPVVKIS